MKIAAMILAYVLVCTSCAYAYDYRPYSELEKQWLARAALAHCGDVITTMPMIGSGEYYEMNGPLADYFDNGGEFLAMKAAVILGTYLGGHYIDSTKWRLRLLKTSFVLGVVPTAWNVGVRIGF